MERKIGCFHANPTDKLAPYLLDNSTTKHWKVIVCKFVLDEITGITNISENKAQVDYTLAPQYSLNGEIAKYADFNKNFSQNLQRSSIFIRYDDGWRILEDDNREPLPEIMGGD